MRAEDLSADHLGETITLETPEGGVTGLLCGVRHEADVSDITQFRDGKVLRYVLGPIYTYLTLMGWGERHIKGATEITIERKP